MPTPRGKTGRTGIGPLAADAGSRPSRSGSEGDGAAFITDPAILLEGLQAGAVGVWRWHVGNGRLDWTFNLEEIHKLPAGSFDGTLESFQRDVHPGDAARVWARIGRSLRSGNPYDVVYRTNPGPDGSFVWVQATGDLVESEDGNRWLTGVCMDVSARIRAETELQRRLRQQQAITCLGSFALGEPRLAPILDRAAETAAEVLGVPFAGIFEFDTGADQLRLRAGIGWEAGTVGIATVGVGPTSQAGFTLIQGMPVTVADMAGETRFARSALLERHGVRSGMSVSIPGSDQRPFGVLGVYTPQLRQFDQADIDFVLALANIVANGVRHVAAAEHRHLLMREMAHRAGNMLQLVVSIANQTFSGDFDVRQARTAFSERLASLSRANYLVADGGWTSTRFTALAGEVLKPFEERLDISGPDILLPPELCFDMGLVLHELATNSAKHGALGEPDGRIRLGWKISRDAEGAASFLLTWDDPFGSNTGQPAGGFGSRLFTAIIERKWKGTIEITAAGSYRFACTIPLPREG